MCPVKCRNVTMKKKHVVTLRYPDTLHPHLSTIDAASKGLTFELALRLRVARSYPQDQYEVHNLYTGARCTDI